MNFGRQGNQSQLLLAWAHRSGEPLWGGEDGWLTKWHGTVTYSYESVGCKETALFYVRAAADVLVHRNQIADPDDPW
jgi:hypothetical protein